MTSAIREIPGFTGYGVTKDGVVYSRVRTKEWVPLTLRLQGQGEKGRKKGTTPCFYLSAHLGHEYPYVHRLVFLAWSGPIPEGMQVDHIDGDKLNNSIENLELVSPSENTKRAVANGLWRSRKGKLNPNSRVRKYEVGA